MAEGKGITRWIRLKFDRDAAKKAEGETAESLERGGKEGGKRAGAATMTELRKEFNKRKAELARDLAAGVIDQKEFKKQTDLAAKTFNAGVVRLMDQAKAQGAKGEQAFMSLGRSIKRVGDDGEKHIGGRLVGALKKAALAAGALFGLRQIQQFASEAMRAAIESEKSATRLRAVWEANAGAVGRSFQELTKFTEELRNTTLFSRDEIELATAQLLTYKSISGETFESTLRLATDLSSVFGGLTQSTQALARALDDPVRGLGELRKQGFTFSDQVTEQIKLLMQQNRLLDAQKIIIRELDAEVGGVAQQMRTGWVGALDQYSKAWEDFREAIGNALLEAGGGTSVMDTLTAAIRVSTEWVTRNADAMRAFVDGGITPVLRGVNALYRAVRGLAELLTGVLFGVLAAGARAFAFLADAAMLAARAKSWMYRVSGDEATAARIDAETERIRQQTKAIREWAAAAEDTAKESLRAGLFPGRGDPTDPPAATPDGRRGRLPGGPIAPADPAEEKAKRDREAEALARLLEKQDAYVANLLREIDVLGRKATATLEGEDAVAALNRQLHIENALLQSGAEAGTEFAETIEHLAGAHWDAMEASRLAADAMQSDWAEAAEAVAEELNALGESAAGVFHAIATGGIAGLARLAKAKVIENIAWAIENTAKALGGLNPAAAAAAKTHMVAAAKWGAVGGVAAAIGGGGGGATVGARAPSTSQAQRAERPGGEVHVHFVGPGFDAVNPQVQRIVYGAMQNASDRVGPNAKVFTHRRTS
jgi:hypothetical protein